MNTTISVSTGFILFSILYGTQVTLPIDRAFPAPPISVATSHVENMKQIIQEEAHTTMAKVQQA